MFPLIRLECQFLEVWGCNGLEVISFQLVDENQDLFCLLPGIQYCLLPDIWLTRSCLPSEAGLPIYPCLLPLLASVQLSLSAAGYELFSSWKQSVMIWRELTHPQILEAAFLKMDLFLLQFNKIVFVSSSISNSLKHIPPAKPAGSNQGHMFKAHEGECSPKTFRYQRVGCNLCKPQIQWGHR